MTKEEYIRQTGYTSPEQAKQDLQAAQMLLMVLMFVALASPHVVSLTAEISIYLALSILAADLVFFGYVVQRCYAIIQKTRQVTLAQIGYAFIFLLAFAAAPFVIVLVPITYLWFVMPLFEPLEIVLGLRKPPESLQRIEQTKASRKRASEGTWRSILVISMLVGLMVAAMMYFDINN